MEKKQYDDSQSLQYQWFRSEAKQIVLLPPVNLRLPVSLRLWSQVPYGLQEYEEGPHPKRGHKSLLRSALQPLPTGCA